MPLPADFYQAPPDPAAVAQTRGDGVERVFQQPGDFGGRDLSIVPPVQAAPTAQPQQVPVARESGFVVQPPQMPADQVIPPVVTPPAPAPAVAAEVPLAPAPAPAAPAEPTFPVVLPSGFVRQVTQSEMNQAYLENLESSRQPAEQTFQAPAQPVQAPAPSPEPPAEARPVFEAPDVSEMFGEELAAESARALQGTFDGMAKVINHQDGQLNGLSAQLQGYMAESARRDQRSQISEAEKRMEAVLDANPFTKDQTPEYRNFIGSQAFLEAQADPSLTLAEAAQHVVNVMAVPAAQQRTKEAYHQASNPGNVPPAIPGNGHMVPAPAAPLRSFDDGQFEKQFEAYLGSRVGAGAPTP